ncbi:F-box associated domain-containing protein [Caenorhabditis elegans]|uniref:F-box associated domain-containing protein n=1 Tax=Caenorhabditis elegans TaxID=6239 RepID=A3RMT5_CAEEL|nr:F-box associated domain-containing protein [Caenorhabditis elegans]CAM35840.1 F-box associated domain-containing protein [Caenorhabditis elegans]|eukprot:NP_001122787.1 Uncharacterized protein CELE_K08E4.8 [Caenorhabditis elegans]
MVQIFSSIGFSLISRVAKNQTERLSLKERNVSFHMTRSRNEIGIAFPHAIANFYLETNDCTNTCSVRYDLLPGYVYWLNLKFGVRQFIDHILETFHLHKIDISIEQSYDYDKTERNFELLKGLKIDEFIMIVWLNFISDFNQQAWKLFSVQSESISLNNFPFEDIKKIHLTACQNHYKASLKLGDARMTLNDILAFNSSILWVNCRPILTDKDVNIFLKHWICGCNRRLEYVHLWFKVSDIYQSDDVDLNILFKNVDYCIAPVEREILAQPYGVPKECFKGGFDVTRLDGTKAIITVDHLYSIFKMVVLS